RSAVPLSCWGGAAPAPHKPPLYVCVFISPLHFSLSLPLSLSLSHSLPHCMCVCLCIQLCFFSALERLFFFLSLSPPLPPVFVVVCFFNSVSSLHWKDYFSLSLSPLFLSLSPLSLSLSA